MSSIRTQLYLLVSSIIKGGTFVDYMSNSYSFDGISDIEYMGFFNSDLQQDDNSVYPLPACLIEYQSNQDYRIEHKTSKYDEVSNSKETTRFILHLICGKIDPKRDQPYIDAMDLAEKVFYQLQGVSVAGIQFIKKVDEYPDVNSSAVMDYQLVFECDITTVGCTSTQDKNATVSITINENPI